MIAEPSHADQAHGNYGQSHCHDDIVGSQLGPSPPFPQIGIVMLLHPTIKLEFGGSEQSAVGRATEEHTTA